MTAAVSDLERHWLETYDCGHGQEIVTVIGDFDFEAATHGFPGFCLLCDPERRFPGKMVNRVSVVELAREDWNKLTWDDQ